jgi:hypothetical protein
MTPEQAPLEWSPAWPAKLDPAGSRLPSRGDSKASALARVVGPGASAGGKKAPKKPRKRERGPEA